MMELLDGVQRELGSAVPNKTKAALDTFRGRLEETSTARRRKRFEGELEAFLQSKPALRGASERYLGERIPPAIEAAVAAMMRALTFLRTTRKDRAVRETRTLAKTHKRKRKHKNG